MKHSREWYTCDRCGKELCATGIFRNAIPRKYTRTMHVNIETVEKEEYVSDIVKNPEIDTCTITVIGGYKTVNKEIHLCGECRKEFEKFMTVWESTYDKEPICKE